MTERWRVSTHAYVIEDADGRVLFKSSAATDRQERLAATAPELLQTLRELLGWQDLADDLTKPLEVRATYMRARDLINRLEA